VTAKFLVIQTQSLPPFPSRLKKVAQVNPAACELLLFCAFLAPDPLPEDVFTQGASYFGGSNLGALLQPVASDQHKLNATLNATLKDLLKYSLIHRSKPPERESNDAPDPSNGSLECSVCIEWFMLS